MSNFICNVLNLTLCATWTVVKRRWILLTFVFITSFLLDIQGTLIKLTLISIATATFRIASRVAYRYVRNVLWLIILASLVQHVTNVDTLLVWTLSFFFGVFSIVALDAFIESPVKIFPVIVFTYLTICLTLTYLIIEEMSAVSILNRRKGKNAEVYPIWRIFYWGNACGAVYVGILEELALEYS